MKHTIKRLSTFILISLALILSAEIVTATTPITKANVKNSLGVSQQQLNQLQASISSQVAHMNLTQKRGIEGTVDNVSNTQITLTDINGNQRFIDLDALTKFSSSTQSSFGVSNISKGQTLGILGTYNKNTQRILARLV